MKSMRTHTNKEPKTAPARVRVRSLAPPDPLSVTNITKPNAMKKTWCVLLVSLLFAAGAFAQPALQTLVTNGLAEPYGVAVDLNNNYYITDSVNNRIAQFNSAGVLTNFAGVYGEPGSNDDLGPFAHFNNPQGIVFTRGGLVVADTGNHRIRFVALNGTVSTLAGSTAGFADGQGTAAQFNAPAGLAADSLGNIYVADQLNNLIRKIDVANNVSTVALGFSKPAAVTVDKVSNLIYVADTGTHSIKVIQPNGTVSLFAGSGSSFISGSRDSLIATNALFSAPRGVLWAGPKTGLLVSDTGNHRIRRVFSNTNFNTYSVETFVGGSLASPVGLAMDTVGNFPLVDLAAGSLLSIQVTKPQPPVANPQIGIVVLTTNAFGDIVTQLNPVSNSTFNNDVAVAILAEEGTETFYTLDPDANFPDDVTSRNTPARYANGMLSWTNSIVVPSLDGSNVLVRAIGMQDGRRPSSVVSARFQYKTANPIINGKNPGNFTLSDETDLAELWYTTDGSAPTNRSPSRLYVPGSHLNIVNGTNDIPFKVRAFKKGYTASAEVSRLFLFSDLETSVIGISKDFSAGIGSTIVVPVEMRVAGADAVRSLQFRVEVSPVNAANPIPKQLRNLTISTNDFIRLPVPSTNPPVSFVYTTNNNTTGLSVAYVGQSSGLELNGTTIAALLAVPIPPAATAGEQYSIKVVEPSGTSDGIQTPVPITVLAPRTITVTNMNYLVGDSAVGIGYNAGDFGNHDLNNNDVNNAFLLSLGLFQLYSFTDLFDSMDAFPPDSASAVGGDGEIRFLDWQVILNRSLRLDSANWERRWDRGGVRVARSATLPVHAADTAGQTQVAPGPGAVWVRQASFSGVAVEDAQPGQSVRVPIYLQVEEGASVSGLQFLAKIQPNGSTPPVATPAVFERADNIPVGRLVDGLAPNTVAYAWDLGAFSAPLEGRVLIGHVKFTVPVSARQGNSYRVRFGNADGAPDQNTQYDFETFPTGVWVGSGAAAPETISDEWKTKFFGSADSASAAPDADPDHDGSTNWQEYLAGTNPVDAQSHLHLRSPQQKWQNGKKQLALDWLSAPGKKYTVETTTDVVNGPWTTVLGGVSGDGNMKEVLDANPLRKTQYYRVRVQK